MDQFRQIGEVVGSLKALMVLEHEISINRRQCCLLSDIYLQAFDTISEEIRQNLRLDERNTKWKVLEHPMRELHRIFKEGESYIKYCLDIKDWWGKAVSLHLNCDCVEFHIHNLLCCFPVVIEAIETAAEIAGLDEKEMHQRRLAIAKKYSPEDWNDPRLFMWKFGKQYLVPRDICSRLESTWKEDRWLLVENIKQKKNAKLGEALIKMLEGPKLLHSSILLRANDYSVKRRLACGGTHSHLKEINWLGESFALRTFYGDVESHITEVSLLLSLSHPNVLQYHCGFHDEEKKEGFLVMELMNKSLDVLVKENSCQKKKTPFSIPLVVDIMLQIGRGMEYLHSRKIYHGELNPSNVLIKPRNESYFHAKVAGFALSSVKRSYKHKSSALDSVIWYAPEVLAEQEQPGSKCTAKYSEKADVYSFGMLSFQLLTRKVPFEDGERPLEGDKIFRNLKAGERPLFPHPSPRYLVNLTKKCWQTDPGLRPSFSSICRILRYVKKALVMNPEHCQPDCPTPLVDFCDIEAGYSKKFPADGICSASQIPFQMFAYKLVERERSSKEKNWDYARVMDDIFHSPSDRRSSFSGIIGRKDFGTLDDQRSVVSESAERKFLSELPLNGDCAEQQLKDSKTDQKPVSPETPEKRHSVGEQTASGLDVPQNKHSGAIMSNCCKTVRSESTQKKTLSNSVRLTKIPENKTLSSSECGQSSTTPEKATALKANHTKIPAKDVPLHKKVKDSKTSNDSGKLKDQSPGSSPGRIKRTHSSPLISSSGITKEYSSPVSSPIHPLKACTPSRWPPANTTRDGLLQSVISPRGQKKAQEAIYP